MHASSLRDEHWHRCLPMKPETPSAPRPAPEKGGLRRTASKPRQGDVQTKGAPSAGRGARSGNSNHQDTYTKWEGQSLASRSANWTRPDQPWKAPTQCRSYDPAAGPSVALGGRPTRSASEPAPLAAWHPAWSEAIEGGLWLAGGDLARTAELYQLLVQHEAMWQ